MQAYDVLEHYCGTTDVHYGHIPNMTTMFTDSFFLYGVTKYIDDYHLKYSSKPVYHYINSYQNENYQVRILLKTFQFNHKKYFQANLFIPPTLSPKLPGVSHGDELFLEWSRVFFTHFDMRYFIYYQLS